MKRKIIILFVLILFVGIIYMYKKPIPLEDLKDKYTDSSSQFIDINDLSVHYRKKGSGMPLLLIHGTSSSLHTWEKWENILSKHYTTYSIDMQGGGLTTPPSNNDYSIQSYINLIDSFVDKMNIDSFYLAGNSLGGHTAWAYAANAQYSDKVKKLILIDPSGFFDKNKEKPAVFKLAQSDILFKLIEHINTKPFVVKSLKEVYYDDDLITDDLIERYTDLGSRKGNRKAFFYKVRQIEEGIIEDLQKINCPTLIMWGENDKWIPLYLSDYFTQNIPQNTLITYENCGHVPMEEIPEKSAADAFQFLKE